jgi:hypothetical protein
MYLKLGVVVWSGVIWYGAGFSGYFKYSNESSDSIKDTEFLQLQSRTISEKRFCSILFTGASKQDLYLLNSAMT